MPLSRRSAERAMSPGAGARPAASDACCTSLEAARGITDPLYAPAAFRDAIEALLASSCSRSSSTKPACSPAWTKGRLCGTYSTRSRRWTRGGHQRRGDLPESFPRSGGTLLVGRARRRLHRQSDHAFGDRGVELAGRRLWRQWYAALFPHTRWAMETGLASAVIAMRIIGGLADCASAFTSA
jgi:hypothetical protein